MLLYLVNSDHIQTSHSSEKWPICFTMYPNCSRSDFSVQYILSFGSSTKTGNVTWIRGAKQYFKCHYFIFEVWNILSVSRCVNVRIYKNLRCVWNIFFFSSWSERLCSCHCWCNCCWNFSCATNSLWPSNTARAKFGLL